MRGAWRGGDALPSGSPALVDDTILGIMSAVRRNCAGNTFSYRLDTTEALDFIGPFLDTPIASTPDESADVTVAAVTQSAAKQQATGERRDREKTNHGKAKTGKSGKSDHGKRRR